MGAFGSIDSIVCGESLGWIYLLKVEEKGYFNLMNILFFRNFISSNRIYGDYEFEDFVSCDLMVLVLFILGFFCDCWEFFRKWSI